MRNTAAKLAFIILKLNVTFINKSYGDTKRRCVRYLTPDPSPLALLHFLNPPCRFVIDDSSWKNAAESFTAALTLTLGGYESAIASPKGNVNVQLNWISRFSKSSWTETTASGLSYELGVNGAKKLMETWILLIKMDIAQFTLVNMRVSVKKTYGY